MTVIQIIIGMLTVRHRNIIAHRAIVDTRSSISITDTGRLVMRIVKLAEDSKMIVVSKAGCRRIV